MRDNNMNDTRHSHGGVGHDHPGGDVSHDHPGPEWPGFSGLPHGVPPAPRSSSNPASAAFSFGTILIVLGGLGLLVESNNHSACGSVLVQALSQSQCQQANAVWTLGVVGLVIGVALLIVGAILRSRS
jgi:hypothetical protein